MKQIYKIKLDLPDIQEFINTTNDITNDINLHQGRAVVSAKSLIGIYSLDLSKPVKLIIRDLTDDDKYIVEKFNKWFLREGELK